MEKIAIVYNVSIYVIKECDFNNQIDMIYMLMRLEEEFPYYEINIDSECYKEASYNMNVANGIRQ